MVNRDFPVRDKFDMDIYRCPECRAHLVDWCCAHCGIEYTLTKDGFPKLYQEDALGRQDRRLRDRLYNNLLGRFYGHLMPLLTLPVRPLRISKSAWLLFSLSWLVIIGTIMLAWKSLVLLDFNDALSVGVTLVGLLPLLLLSLFFLSQPYIFWLLVLAVPLKLNHICRPWHPEISFQRTHQQLHSKLKGAGGVVRLLDVSTGSCNSLIRHGWMDVAQRVCGIDLSETMLRQGKAQLKNRGLSAELVLGNAEKLPYADDVFDMVLNYGAVNGYSYPGLAIAEMLRVTRSGGTLLLFDEQCHFAANSLERFYFSRVLASHDSIDQCPVDALESAQCRYQCFQVYQYYYLCVIEKR